MMKKSIFKVGFLTTLILILLVSCTSPSEETSAKLPALTNKQKVANSSALPDVYEVYDIPAYIGALHNASIYAFVDYVHENNLSPFEVGGLTEAMIDTFAMNYVNSMLSPLFEQFEINDSVHTDIFDMLCMEYNNIINSTSDVDEINIAILERTEYVYGCFGVQDEDMVIYDVIKEIAIATNVLWGRNWDFMTPIFEIPDYASDNDNEGEENNDEKSEEDMRELKKADISGAVEGAIEGAVEGGRFGWITGAWGAVGGAALGATIASIKEWVAQEMEEAAVYMGVDYVVPNSYLYNYLLMLKQTNPEQYYDLYGDKFDCIL